MARVLAVAPDLFFASKISETLRAAGHEVTVVAEPPSAAEGHDAMLVDLNSIDAADAVAAGVPTLGFYSHVDAETRQRATEAGIDLVVPRSRMARDMPELVARLLA